LVVPRSIPMILLMMSLLTQMGTEL
jgi:hypothetical protein